MYEILFVQNFEQASRSGRYALATRMESFVTWSNGDDQPLLQRYLPPIFESPLLLPNLLRLLNAEVVHDFSVLMTLISDHSMVSAQIMISTFSKFPDTTLCRVQVL